MVATVDVPKRGMPVTIITGFLGSGKTTLLNHILRNQQGLKVAVLVNEFGDINIDSQLLVSVDQDMVELSNGCICCTINESLVEAVYNVLERSDRVDYMVLETTGVADPLPIALTFLGTELQYLTRLDSILTVIDSETFTPEHFNSEAAYNQMMYSDIIILNKTDLTTPEKLTELEQYIRKEKTGARILHSTMGVVPLPLILDVNLADSSLKDIKPHDHHDHDHDHHHHHSHHLENDGFISVSFQADRPLNLDRFQHFLDKQLPIDVFRAKGILWFENLPPRYIFQLSGKRYELKTDETQAPQSVQLVLIGRNLDGDIIKSQLKACLVP
ncbi:MAG: GTP-binding protein [Cyanobacteria bacterium KgW148]|nr:GTP-binding protein [Cyanobacteria bacterium KgW148]